MPIHFTTDELHAWLRLSLEPGLSPAQARLLLGSLGLPPSIYEASSSMLLRYLPQELVAQIRQAPDQAMSQQIAKTVAWLEHEQHHILTLADPLYPAALLELHDPPLILYINGQLDYLRTPALAMVGARNATPGGMAIAQEFASYLASQGWLIYSGLANGIDQAAHRGALAAGPQAAGTIAVMGTGIDLVYPASQRQLAHDIVAHGALISELPLGTKALPYHFPRRNRIVAALSQGVLVVEAARQSGSLITARLATELGREVFAIPGSIHSPLSRGCHALIRQGAKLVEQAQDILEELAPKHTAARSPTPHLSAEPSLSALAKQVLRLLDYSPQSADSLQALWAGEPSSLSQGLTELELANLVTRLDTGSYQRLPS